MAEENELIVWREGAAGRIRLNRPKALNALTHRMCLDMEATLLEWRDDGDVACVIVDAEGDKAFCSGGDVATIWREGKKGVGFFRDEYRLNHVIRHYPKPYVALVDGINMGGGVGISAHGSHRVMSENALVAMPEVSIGFIPDVGGTRLLADAPGEIGRFLGMTAARIRSGDALHAGLADYHVGRDRLEELAQALADSGDADSVCEDFADAPVPGFLRKNQDVIDDVFGRPEALECRNALALHAELHEWATKAVTTLVHACPLSIAATHHAVGRAKYFSEFEESLELEYRFAWHMLDAPNFYEGVRALLIEKDKDPKWSPETLEEVTPEMIEACFAPLPDGEEWSLEDAARN